MNIMTILTPIVAYRETVGISERNRREYDDNRIFCPAKIIVVAIDI